MSKFHIGDKVKAYGRLGKVLEINELGIVIECDKKSDGVQIGRYPNKWVMWPYESQVELVSKTYELHITCNDGKTTNAVYKVNGKIEKRTEAVCAPSDAFDFATGAQTAFDRVFPKAQPTQPIAPQEDKAKFKVGDKVKVIGNHCCHGYSRGAILTLVRSNNFIRREPDWYVSEGTDYVSELDIEPYAEPEKEPEPVYYNGKVVCTATDGDGTFTVGKVYEFIDGQVLDNKSYKRPTAMKMESLDDEYLADWYYRFIPYLGEA